MEWLLASPLHPVAAQKRRIDDWLNRWRLYTREILGVGEGIRLIRWSPSGLPSYRPVVMLC
jgi:hypothetical protein